MTIVIDSSGLIRDQVEWRVKAGSDAFARFRLVEDATAEPRVPVDLSGYEARCQARARYGATDTLADLSTQTGEIEITPVEGLIEIRLPAEQSRRWSARVTSGVFDVELVAPSGIVQALVPDGILAVQPNATIEEAP